MIRISSGWTLVLRIFTPLFYTVFMLAWTIMTIYAGDEVSPLFEHAFYKVSMIVLLVLMILLFRYTVWKLKRMDVDPEHIYITDYFKTFRYSLQSVDRIKPYSIGPWKFLKIILKGKGSLGDSFTILIESRVWNQFIIAHPAYQPLIAE